jgi:hypothetical protein
MGIDLISLLRNDRSKKFGYHTITMMKVKLSLLQLNNSCNPYCPPEFVGYVIAGLSKEFNATGDLFILDEALENHRKNGEQYCNANTNLFKAFHRRFD